MKYIIWFNKITAGNASLVGGKNASLGYMISELSDKVAIPNGFAITVDAYWDFLRKNSLTDRINQHLEAINFHKLETVREQAQKIRACIIDGTMPDDMQEEIAAAYAQLCAQYKHELPVAVRSSATAEDLPTASFAGQQETYLHILGVQDLVEAVKKCMASLFTERAIVYRKEHGFADMQVGLSVGVQKMVQSDNGAAGVAFSVDTETGFKDVIVINSSWGLGEAVVKGAVTPDEFVVFKPTLQEGFRAIIKKSLGDKQTKMLYDPSKEAVITQKATEKELHSFSLSDDEVLELSGYVLAIESFYSVKHGGWQPQDIEWAKDGVDGRIYIVQARPETVHAAQKIETYVYQLKADRDALTILAKGVSIGQQIASGNVCVIHSIEELAQVKAGDIIVTQMTDPDWVPAMQKAAGIITDRGGRTCHAAIVSRELGIPAIVGTGNATEVITRGEVTIDCSQGQTGYIYEGLVPFEKNAYNLHALPKVPVTLLVNCADPDRALSLAHLPVEGVGLARLEFILTNQIGIHPMAIVEPERIDLHAQEEIKKRSAGYESPKQFFIERLARGIGMIAAAYYPHEVIVRLSDFKSNEYRKLVGGQPFEPMEENPMLGWRGASRYYDPAYAQAFALECEAFKMARNQMGFTNVRIMVPFIRTINEAHKVVNLLASHDLERGKDGLQLVMMVEVPSNVLLIEQFAHYFDGFSIGSNDLTQLTLGIDRDSEKLAPLFNEQDAAVKTLIKMAITGAHAQNKFIGICGQAPSDYPEFAAFLIKEKIDSISLNPDAIIPFLLHYKDH